MDAIVKFFLNISLLSAMLLAPAMLLLAHWYRKRFRRTLILWRRPEMVAVTISFFIAALVCFITGISSLFAYFGFLRSSQLPYADKFEFLDVSLACGLFLIALVMVYIAMRNLLIRVITDAGIIINDRYLRVPTFRKMIRWEDINDYFVISDYPNVIFNLILNREDVQLRRYSLRVPVYVRDEFEQLLEEKMNEIRGIRQREEIGDHPYFDN